jgi:hypothetical protein
MRKHQLFVAALIIFANLVAGAQELGIAAYETNPPDFVKMSYSTASAAVDSELNDIMGYKTKKICPEYISNLVSQIRNGNLNNDNKILSIYLLGALGPSDTNSIDVLIEYIDLKALRFDPAFGTRRWGEYPAEEALVKIGEPAISPILAQLSIEQNDFRRHLMCEVVRIVENRKAGAINKYDGKTAIRNLLKDRLDKEADPTKKANLELALREFEK